MSAQASPTPFLAASAWVQLEDAAARYEAGTSPYYDEVLNEVAARTAHTGSIGKADIGALVLWKRVRSDSLKRLLTIPDLDVRAVTANMVAAATSTDNTIGEAASSARAALTVLPGFNHGDALASALIVAANPPRFAVYDKRAHNALTQLGIVLTTARGCYSRYMKIIAQIVEESATRPDTWTPRRVDLALFTLGETPRV